jgi:hypothetical protein
MGETYRAHGKRRNAQKIFIGKPEGRPRRRLEGNIKMYLWRMGWAGMAWIHVTKDR